jgi:acetyl esterase
VALHPQCAAFLAPGADAPELIDIPISEGRAGAYADMSISGEVSKSVEISNRFIPGLTADLLVRIYRPTGLNLKTQKTLKNGLVYFHGGGWSYFSVDMYDAQLSALAEMTDSVVVSINYQKSPEHKFPIPHDDCFTGLKWVFEHAQDLGINISKIGVGGDSAGGNLAAGVALRNRDEKLFPLAYQLLIYPCVGVDFETLSYNQNASGYGLSKRTMSWLWSLYLNSEKDYGNPYAVPLNSPSSAGLPPAIVITAEYDVLRDDGSQYAEKLRADGVEVIYRDYPGMIHGFFNYGKFIDDGIIARTHFADAIKELLSK